MWSDIKSNKLSLITTNFLNFKLNYKIELNNS